MALNPEDLSVETFPTSSANMAIGGTDYCCTGCTSGCGINPTAGGCESKSGDVVCPDQPITVAAE